MPQRPLFNGQPPSRRATARRFPEEWAWWQASGWEMCVEDAADGGLHLHTLRRGRSTRIGITSVPAEAAASPENIGRFLTQTLYLHLHPRKGEKQLAATGQVCDEQQLQVFIRQQRRKVAAGRVS